MQYLVLATEAVGQHCSLGPGKLAGWFTVWALSSSVVLALVSVMIEMQYF